MNEDLEKIDHWLKTNVSKTNLVICSSSVKPAINSIIMNGEENPIVRQIKYLAVIIDQALNFKNNADNVCKKVAMSIGQLSRL